MKRKLPNLTLHLADEDGIGDWGKELRRMKSPTAKTMAYYRQAGYLVDVAERWVPGANIRKDLFGVIDLVAITPDEPIMAIQATSLSNLPARVAKARASSALAVWLRTGARFVIIGWGARGPKIVELRGEDMVAEVVINPPRRKPRRWHQREALFDADETSTTQAGGGT